MKSSGLGVFDFSEEDELPDVAAGKILEKFKNPNSKDNALLKYKFLECVSQETSVKRDIVRNTHCVDVDSVNCDKKLDNAVSSTPECTTGDDFAKNEENPRLDAAPLFNSSSQGQPGVKLDNQEPLSLFAKSETRVLSLLSPSPMKHLINSHSDSPLRVEPLDVFADADECVSESTTSSPSDMAEDGVSLNGWASDHCFDDMEMDQGNMAVMLRPDYFIYQDTYCTESLVTFSESYIRAVGYGSKETFNFEWGINDIVDIKCQWFQGVDMILIKLHVVSKDAVQNDNEGDTAGMEELKFAVVEPNWAEKQTQITCLNDKYSDIWDVVPNDDMYEDDVQGRSYFPRFDEPFEEVVYPKGDVDAVSISKRDVDLLQPETFINDTIIDFYIKYLKNQIQSEERTRFHFFNSFFFRKLADLDKDPSSASDGRAAFLRVRKWTRKVDLFKKDYIFIPVNFNLHWSLIVICHPDEVATFREEELDQLHKVPCILHMDSIKGSHSGLKNLVQSYLWEEWKERQMEISEQISSKFLNLRFIELELPQQENSFDCGLFLLHYLELFLAEAPVGFNPFQINEFSAFLNVDWFPPVEASLKRGLIQKLIFELLENRSREISSAACSDERISSKFPENNKKETRVVSSHQNILGCQMGEGIEITLLASSSVRSPERVNDSGLVLRDLLEPGAAEGSSLGQYQLYEGSSLYHPKGGIVPSEEDGETGEDFVLFPSEETAFGLTSQGCSVSQTSMGFKADTAWDPPISGHATRGDDANLAPEASDCGSDDDIGIIEHFPTSKGMDLSQEEEEEEEEDRQNSLSMENIEDVTKKASAVEEGSEEPNKVDSNKIEHLQSKACPSIQIAKTTEGAIETSQDLDNTHAICEDQVLSQDSDKILNNKDTEDHAPEQSPRTSELGHEHTESGEGNVEGDDMAGLHGQQPGKRSGDEPELEGQEAVKKMRLTPPDEIPL